MSATILDGTIPATQLTLGIYSQRWFEGRTSFRLSREPIDPTRYGVEQFERPAPARDFVMRHHYSRSFSPCITNFGLFRKDSPSSAARLVGVATFAQASNIDAVTKWSGLDYSAGAELTRFILLDEEPGNAESWFLSRAIRMFKEYRPSKQILLSYSDPVPRRAIDGRLVLPGHCGGIYQSCNASYLGRSAPRQQWLAADGRAIAARLITKLRNGETGRAYAEKALSEASGLNRYEFETPTSFIDRALSNLRCHRHPGNHLYAFPLAATRREKHHILNLPTLRAHARGHSEYPKRPDAEPEFAHNLKSSTHEFNSPV